LRKAGAAAAAAAAEGAAAVLPEGFGVEQPGLASDAPTD